jgi:hypothetical protein
MKATPQLCGAVHLHKKNKTNKSTNPRAHHLVEKAADRRSHDQAKAKERF